MEPNPNQSPTPSENPVVTQPTPSYTTQKKSTIPMILGILILLFLVGGGAYYMGTQSNKPSQNTTANIQQKVKATPTTTAEDTPALAIHNFPLYPNSTFLKKQVNPPCSEEHSGYSDCGSTAYIYGVSEDSDKVQTWYIKDTSNQRGWELKGGAGSMGSMTTQTWQEKNSNFQIVLQVSSRAADDTLNKNYKTIIQVLVLSSKSSDQTSENISTPTPSYKSPLTADATHKIYVNNSYRFSFLYPADFVINSSSTPERISFLQKQDTLMAQRLLVTVYKNPQNLSLKDFAKRQDASVPDSRIQSQVNPYGHEILTVTKDPSNANCNDGRTFVQRIQAGYVKVQNYIVEFVPNDNCESQSINWLSPIINYFSL